MFEIDGTEIPFSWEVERHELGDGYVLRDARVHSDAGGELRAFAIEDIAASVGIGIAAAAGVVFGWRVLGERRAAAEARKLWDDCIARGGSPSWSYDVVDEVGVEVGVEGPGLRITSGAKPSVRCDMSSAAR
jgi:hypothetical protein